MTGDAAPPGPVGILGAMNAEVFGLISAMAVEEAGTTAGFQYWRGELAGEPVVLARCGMGKVSAAMGVQRMIDEWRVRCVIVCGLAGGLAPGLRVGDIVIGQTYVQHDLDASPIYPQFEVPGLGISRFAAEPDLVTAAYAAATEVAATIDGDEDRASPEGGALQHRDDLYRSTVYSGLIVTGDQFVRNQRRQAILDDLPDALCVEMEGGAIAQVCTMNSVPFVIVRVISDTADGDAPADFTRFAEERAPAYTVRIVRALVAALPMT